MKVLVIGTNGQLGKDLIRVLGEQFNVHGCTRHDMDITRLEQCREMICKVRRDAIIHAVAYTAVDLAEPKNDSNRVDETCIKIKGQWNYLYRAVDSNFNTIDFMQAANRDIDTAKRFFKKALSSPHNQSPRVITVDKNTAYPLSIQQLMNEKALSKEMHMIRKGQAEYKSTVLSTVELINRLFGLVA